MTQTAVITGGTGGMGLAPAEILGRDHRVVSPTSTDPASIGA
ncbi:hypothetical protein [Nocardia vaccinii]|nr:hypothetical protein [Nocardia vaccinii]